MSRGIIPSARPSKALRYQSSPALKDRCNDSCQKESGNNALFQSSPALKDRCNASTWPSRWGSIVFQSSPALKDRCNFWLILPVSPIPRFQSSPALKDRCNGSWKCCRSASQIRFQSSPALKDRCNLNKADAVHVAHYVSILTGLERPVQRPERKNNEDHLLRFNPHRP